jgi:4-hydroxybenzoate polyprenyltransferase
MINASLQRIRDFGKLVKFSHTIFLFPFALSAVVLAHQIKPVTIGVLFWMVVALVAARSAAMIMNRIADKNYDALNPRTAGRPLVTGRVGAGLAWLWLALACAVFVLAAAMLNPLALAFSPVALVWILGYSFTKRFTMLCHLWLGMATALAPAGAWIAVTGAWDWRAAVLIAAVALWVAGFDVIYACQDIDFDKGQALHSIPARLGLKRALWASRLMHLGALAGFFILQPLFSLGIIYFSGTVLVAVILIAEQALVAYKRANIPMAFFTLNGVVSVMFFFALLADRLAGA